MQILQSLRECFECHVPYLENSIDIELRASSSGSCLYIYIKSENMKALCDYHETIKGDG